MDVSQPLLVLVALWSGTTIAAFARVRPVAKSWLVLSIVFFVAAVAGYLFAPGIGGSGKPAQVLV